MPTSHSELKDWMFDKFKSLKPTSVVDVGPGNGTYSELMRHVCPARWMAIEAWGPYVPQFNLWSKYDHVVISDLRHVDFMSVHPCPDLIIIGDCLEHIPKDEAVYQLKRYCAWGGALMISVPLGEYPQEPLDANWFERHHATWNRGELVELLQDYGDLEYEEGEVLGVYLWKS